VFAAGCAICGADLEQHRRRLEASRVKLPAPAPRRRLPRVRIDAHATLVVFTILAMLLSPFLGVLLAGLGAQDRHRNGQIGQRNLFLALVAVSVALALVPALRFGIWSLL
jgi:hypothetical protein